MFKNNVNTIRVFLFLIFLFWEIGISLFAQASIGGKITDKEIGEELIGAAISVFKNGELIIKETADFDGNYSVRLEAGIRDL